MFRKLIFSICFLGMIVLLATGAMAFGIGGYMTVGGGNTSHDYDKWEHFATGQMKQSSDLVIGGGLVMDSNLANNRIFNWRMKIGGDQLWLDREKEMKMSRMRMDHTFGFGVVRTKIIRFWFGPRIGGNYSWGDRTSQRYYAALSPLSYTFQKIAIDPSIWNAWVNSGALARALVQGEANIFRDKINKIRYGGLDVGFVVGLNFNIGDFVTIGPEVGFKYAWNWGLQEREINYGIPSASALAWYVIPINTEETKEILKLNGYEIYGNISVMFRVGGDKY